MHGSYAVLFGDITDCAGVPFSADIYPSGWDLYALRASGSGSSSQRRTAEIFAQGLRGIGVNDSTRYDSATGERYREYEHQ